MLRPSLKLIECFIFCMLTTGAGSFLSLHFGLGQPWMYLVILIGTFILAAINSKRSLRFDVTQVCLIVCGLGYLSSFLIETGAVDGLSLYLVPLLGFLLCKSTIVQSERRTETLAYYLMTSLVIICFSMIIEPFILFSDLGYLNRGQRLSGFVGNANLAAFYIISHLVCIKLVWRKIPLSIFLLSAVCIVLTVSRAAILCVVTIFLFDFLRRFTITREVKYISLIAVVAVGVLLSSFSQNDITDSFDFSRINPLAQQSHLQVDSSRIDVISTYFQGINDRPIIGNGPSKGMNQEVRAHNTFLNIWYEVGFIPVLAFFSFLIFLFLQTYQWRSLFNVFLVCFIFSFFINSMIVHSIFWLLLGCCYIAKRRLGLQVDRS
mgnify:CR=1 FL=1